MQYISRVDKQRCIYNYIFCRKYVFDIKIYRILRSFYLAKVHIINSNHITANHVVCSYLKCFHNSLVASYGTIRKTQTFKFEYL